MGSDQQVFSANYLFIYIKREMPKASTKTIAFSHGSTALGSHFTNNAHSRYPLLTKRGGGKRQAIVTKKTVPLRLEGHCERAMFAYANFGGARLQSTSKFVLYSLARTLRRRNIYIPKGVLN